MTTTQRYQLPNSGPETTTKTTDARISVRYSYDVLTGLAHAADAARSVDLVGAGGASPAMSAEERARLLWRLADLSVDADSMDRESEVDIWGMRDD